MPNQRWVTRVGRVLLRLRRSGRTREFHAAAILAALGAAATLVLPAGSAVAFDTGPHAGITIDALTRVGFNRNASDVVQVENWLTDYYTSSPTIGGAAKCDLEKLHFDDVFSSADVANYWTTLAANTKAAAKQAEADNDVLEFYVALGMSLHVVQDFYAHSNWVEQHSQRSGRYDTTTWFQTSNPPSGLYTGWYANCLNIPQANHVPHGGYTWGLNHDSVVRPNYDRAYVYAYAASYEWTNNVLDWLGSSFATRVKTYNPTPSDASDLVQDQKASVYVSEWIQNPLNESNLDGHWNGNRSGYAAAFAKFIASWTGSHDSVFVKAFKNLKTYETLSKNLYSGPASGPPLLKACPTSGTIFAMRTLSVYANSAITGTDSYYGQLAALNTGNGGYHYRDASQHHLPRTKVPWLQLIFVPSSQGSIDFDYELWNEWITTNNDLVPIKGSQKTLRFTCRTSNVSCTGDVSGGPWSASSPFTTSGSGGNGVKLQLYFTAAPASP